MRRFLVVNGPNLNLLGKREPHIYGTKSLADLMDAIRDKATELGVQVDFFQGNGEGEIIAFLQKEGPGSAGIIINPASFAHYSLALFDCLQALAVPTIEVHISRSKMVTARAARGVIAGLGFTGYLLAMEYLAEQPE